MQADRHLRVRGLVALHHLRGAVGRAVVDDPLLSDQNPLISS
jgi:hypothetical protein